MLVGAGWTPTGRPGGTAGSAVEGAVVALVKTLARDLGPAGITVNEVVVPAGQDDPEGVARAVGYLSSPAAGAVVGQLLTVGAGGELRPCRARRGRRQAPGSAERCSCTASHRPSS